MKRTRYFRLMTHGQHAARGTPMLWRWRSTALKRTSRFSGVLLLALLLAPWLAFGQQTGPQPGDTDPLGGPSAYTLLRDDELFISFSESFDNNGNPAPPDNLHFATASVADHFLELDQGPQQVVETWSTQSHQFFAASGRPLQPDKDHVVVAQRSGAPNSTSDILLRFFQGDQVQSYTLANAQLAPRAVAPSSDFLDVAVGDLDRLPDSSGAYHDEVVVCWTTLDNAFGSQFYVPHIAVLDYTDPAANPTAPLAVTSAQAGHWVQQTFLNDTEALPTDNPVSIAIGDFDGDGRNEIGFAVIEAQTNSIWVSIFRYTNDGAGSTLTENTPQQYAAPSGWRFTATVDLAAANVDGDAANRDELLLGSVIQQNLSFRSQLWVYAVSTSLVPTLQSSIDVATDTGSSATDSRTRIQLVPGLFTYDPAAGFDINRREVFVFRNRGADVVGQRYTVATDLKTISLGKTVTGIQNTNNLLGQRWAAAAGRLDGDADISDPTWRAAVQTYYNNYYITFRIDDFFVDGCIGCIAFIEFNPNVAFDPTGRPAIAVYDHDGDSVLLGAPVHIQATDLQRTNYVLQEPPKHSYWDPATQKVQDLTRFDNFFVTLKESSGQSLTSTNKQTSGWNIGVSGEVTAVATAKEGKDWGIFQADAEEKGHFTIGSSYGYDKDKEAVDSQFLSVNRTFDGETKSSDWVDAQLQTFDIWRYRIYGTSFTDPQTQQPSNGYYEVTIPGPLSEQSGDPLNWDWYQPVHENGNVLSYPPELNTNPSLPSLQPADLGTVQLINPQTGDSVGEFPGLLYSGRWGYTDNTGEDILLSYDGDFSSGDTISYSNAIKANADIAGTVQTGLKIPFVKATLDLHGKLAADGGYSWGGTDTAENQSTLSTEITLTKPNFDTNQAYGFYPVFYVTGDGTLKVEHAADVTGSNSSSTGSLWWADNYGQLPDAALNLPSRFSPKYNFNGILDGWEPYDGSTRGLIRGFFLTEPSASPISGDFVGLYGPATAGDTVRIAVRVYNYTSPGSGKNLNNLTVRFFAVPYQDGSDAEFGTRTLIGEVQGISVSAEERWTMAELLWNTAGFGPLTAGATQHYRIYVVLDPYNAIAEKYDSTGDCTFDDNNLTLLACPPGQNNQGWGLASVVTPPDSASQALAAEPAPEADLSLGEDSFAALAADGEFNTKKVTAQLNETVRLRVAVHSDQHHPFHRWLVVYDGKPGKKGSETIAMKRVHGLERDRDRHVWIDWHPRTPGRHDLHAVVVERGDDPIPGNNVATLSVVVTGGKPPKP